MQKFYNGVQEIEIPTCLEELTPDQYKYFITLSSVYNTSSVMTEDDYRVRWLSYLSGLETVDFTLLVPERKKCYQEAMSLTDGFFIRSKDGRLLPDFDTPVNLLKVEGDYKGPGDWLEGLTFGEFTECTTVLGSLPEGEDEIKEAYGHVARVVYHIPESEPVPEILYFHAPLFFRNVLRRIERDPIEINGEKIDFRIIFQSNKTGKNYDDKTGWTGITFEVASSGVFGGVKEVEKTDFWMVLLYLYRCKFEYLHSKRKGG